MNAYDYWSIVQGALATITLSVASIALGIPLGLGLALIRWARVPVLDRFEPQNAMGWASFLDILEDTVKGREVLPRRVYLERNAGLYGVDLANLQR